MMTLENRGQLELENDRFYLPNLCTPQSLLFIVLAGTLLAIVFTLVDDGLQHFSWESFALKALFILWIVLVSVGALCKLRPWLAGLGLMAGSLFSYGLVLAVTLILSLLAQWLLSGGLGGEGRALQNIDLWNVAQHVLIAAILGGVSLRYFYLQEQLHIQQRAELASRIQALQSRIRPHFLFNSMNIIASLIETEPALAERVVEDLSELFRATLSEANQLVPVQEEIDLGKNYLHIEGLRLGERLQTDWQIAPELLSQENAAVLPHLSLQPLLENAVYHGIQPLVEGGTITISIQKVDNQMVLQVRNPVASENARAKGFSKAGNHLALNNLRSRLIAYYGSMANLTTGTVGEYFEVKMQCPLQPTNRDNL